MSKDFLHKPVFHILLISFCGLLAYSNTFHVPFLFDDIRNIVENHMLRDLGNLWPPSGSRWFGFLTFALNYKLHGLDVTGYHIVNLAIHLINSILFYFLVIVSFQTPFLIKSSLKNNSGLIAFTSGLIFVAHPIHTQAVTYIVQRFASLATLFYLLSLVTFIKWRLLPQTAENTGQTRNRNGLFNRLKSALWYLSSVLTAILAMKTKEISFTLPVIITLYEFMFFHGSVKKRLLALFPLALTMLIIPFALLGADKPLGELIGDVSEATKVTTALSRWEYLFTQFRVIVTYIRLLFLPINQNLDYDYPIYHSFTDPAVFVSFLFLAALFGTGVYLLNRSRPSVQPVNTLPLSEYRLIAFGIFWFFITLSVESSIIPITDVIFEHRLYLPSTGAFLAIIVLLFLIFEKKTGRRNLTITGFKIAITLTTLVLTTATFTRNITWQTIISLWGDVVTKSPNNPRGHNNLGIQYYDRKMFKEAVKHYQIALRLKPDFAEAYNNLGNVYYDNNMRDLAIEQFEAALRFKPDYPIAHYNLANAYSDKINMSDQAIEHYHVALSLKPEYIDAYNNLGAAYQNKGLIDKAAECYSIALKLKPDYAEAQYNLGIVYSLKGLSDEAIAAFEQLLVIAPNYAEAHYKLAAEYRKKGLNDKAEWHYRIATELSKIN